MSCTDCSPVFVIKAGEKPRRYCDDCGGLKPDPMVETQKILARLERKSFDRSVSKSVAVGTG